MNEIKIRDVRIVETQALLSPDEMAMQYPVTEKAAQTVMIGREEVQRILRREDDRFLVVIGPCSIHDLESAIEYAKRLAELRAKYADRMCIVMRVYFEKPRTTVGWRGLIMDPGLDGTADIPRGLRLARDLLVKVNEMGLPCGSEMLDPIVPQYTSDLVSWASIGARTTESQTHREMASGLSMPVGFKNATDGDVQIAVNAIVSSRQSHSFIGITREGSACIMQTLGNPDSHLILRGGKTGTNYDRASVENTASLLKKAGIRPSIIVDCSHGNSKKKPENQIGVLNEIIRMRNDGENPLPHLCGCMIESFLETGCQSITADPAELKKGLSITDPCLGWEMTESALGEAYKLLGETFSSVISKKEKGDMSELTVYTDGGCSGNPGPGGWGYVIVEGRVDPELGPADPECETIGSGGERETTNNRMELTAVIEALGKIKTQQQWVGLPISVYTDSQYVQKGISQWITGWKRNGWKTASKDPVKNRDLWMALDTLVTEFTIRWVWVKGHAGVHYNEVCDQLTQEEIEKNR